jgi:hypothetical protein
MKKCATLIALSILALNSQVAKASPHETSGDAFGGRFFGTSSNVYTVADGTMIFSRGTGGSNPFVNDTTFTLTNNVIGQINMSVKVDPLLITTTIISGDKNVIKGEGFVKRVGIVQVPAIWVDHTKNRGDANILGDWNLREGIYLGGGMLDNVTAVDIRGSSFIGWKSDARVGLLTHDRLKSDPYAPMPVGLKVLSASNLSISNRTGEITDAFIGNTSVGFVDNSRSELNGSMIDSSGGNGLYSEALGNVVVGGDFYGADGASSLLNYLTISTDNHFYSEGGDGAEFINRVDITAGNYYGGDGGELVAVSKNSMASTSGGYGLRGANQGTIKDARFIGGKGGTVEIYGDGSTALANGGSGIFLENDITATLDNVTAIGDRAGSAVAFGINATAYAVGGHGIHSINTDVTIGSGTFTGANGGSASSAKGSANASGGAGAMAVESSLTINGGTYTGGEGGIYNGTSDIGGYGIIILDGSLTISEAVTNTMINGDVYFDNTTANDLTIEAGTITGDILKTGSGTATVKVQTNANYSGAYVHVQGISDVQLGDAAEAHFFSEVSIIDEEMKFTGQKVITATGSTFTLYNPSSILTFDQGVELSENSRINTGYGTIKTAGGGFVMKGNSSINVNFDFLNDESGLLDITGDLIATNYSLGESSQIIANGTAVTSDGTNQIAKVSENIMFIDLQKQVSADFGWLVSGTVTNGLAGFDPGIQVMNEYYSLMNYSELDSVNDDVLTYVDGIVSGLGSNDFYQINSLGADDGTKEFNYSLSLMPDTADAAFNTQQKLTDQLAARGSEFRSMNGYASTQPSWGKKTSPIGAAGPATDKNSGLQGWIRSYGSFADHDSDDGFTQYDNNSWGTVIGIDQCFGNLLIGLAGGYTKTHLDGGSTYDSDMNTYYGSIYSTFGGESAFIDLALTYGQGDADDENDLTYGDFDTEVFSAYIGAGKVFNITEKIALTPEASFLASYYDQDGYTRKSKIISTLDTQIDSYDQWSQLSSIGITLATTHQIDWANRGLAIIPEVRAHWLHEFNSDLDDGKLSIGGNSSPLLVRSREEDIYRLGFGFDVWSWKYQNSKFEVDYDGLIADDYTENVISGKVTFQF